MDSEQGGGLATALALNWLCVGVPAARLALSCCTALQCLPLPLTGRRCPLGVCVCRLRGAKGVGQRGAGLPPAALAITGDRGGPLQLPHL